MSGHRERAEELTESEHNTRAVMCVNTWPEDDASDFLVTHVRKAESDSDAITRAAKSYGSNNTFYIVNQ